MRKKIFATLMSVAMVASFMPSLAFAANTSSGHAFYECGTDYEIINGKASAINGVDQKNIDKYVEVVTAPTCNTKGVVKTKCHATLPDGVACDEVKTEEFALEHSYVNSDMSLEEFAAQKYPGNDAEAKGWVKAQKRDDKCYVEAKRCKYCGAVNVASSTVRAHEADQAKAAETCADEVPCKHTGCTVMIKNTWNDGSSPKEHDYTGVTATTSTTGCGGVTVTKKQCKNCNHVDVTEAGTANCKEFVGDIPASAVSKSFDGTKVFYNGKNIATINAGAVTPENGYYYDANRDVFVKADTTKVVSGTKKYGYTCKHCGYVKVFADTAASAPACDHNWTKVTVDATCNAPAKEYMVCSECGNYRKVADTYATDVKTTAGDASTDVKDSKKLGHDLVVKTIAGDCQGTMRYEVKCSRKGCNQRVVVTADNFKNLAKGTSLYINPADETLSASTTNIAGSVELKYIENSNGDNHKFVKKTIKDASCENNQLVGFVCETCGKINIHSATIVPGTKLAHELEVVEIPATCEHTAGKIEKCKNCKYEKTLLKSEVITGGKCLEDTWKVVKPATVFEEGIKTVACSKCGDVKANATKVPTSVLKYAAPTVKAGKKSITVTAKATEGATSYKISYKKAGGKYVTKTVEAGKKVTIKKLAKGKKYTVKAVAINADGVKAFSAAKTVKTK